MKRTGIGFGLLLAATISPAWAVSDALIDGMRRCAAQSDQAQRLACFDTLASTLPKIEADRFGLTADIANKRDPQSERHDKEAVLPGKIVALGAGPRGEYIFTLDNGQVWTQADLEPNKKFAVGDVVHIEHGAMGSLWLAADKARKTRVKRIS
ncbi:MAG TPA: hypothetical protein VHZ99_07975 [Steroidobacteraceae bacterium]|jgi:hypothetical protein|nr:hypothetical protein [Steroidobacteraceae bacterium]